VPALASSKWWKEERHGVFLDYNQNAKDRTTCSAYSVRPLPDARVSTPLHWHEVPDCNPADFTIFTIPERFAKIGNPHADMDAAPGLLEKLLELAEKDEAAGLGDAPWPPHFRKMEREAPRVAPSRTKSAVKKPRVKMPLIVVANSPDKGPRWRVSKGGRGNTPGQLISLRKTTCSSTLCEAGHRRGPASESTCVMFRKAFARRKEFPTLMMIRRANGAGKEQISSWRQTQRL
jgi:hypothetical protein